MNSLVGFDPRARSEMSQLELAVVDDEADDEDIAHATITGFRGQTAIRTNRTLDLVCIDSM